MTGKITDQNHMKDEPKDILTGSADLSIQSSSTESNYSEIFVHS